MPKFAFFRGHTPTKIAITPANVQIHTYKEKHNYRRRSIAHMKNVILFTTRVRTSIFHFPGAVVEDRIRKGCSIDFHMAHLCLWVVRLPSSFFLQWFIMKTQGLAIHSLFALPQYTIDNIGSLNDITLMLSKLLKQILHSDCEGQNFEKTFSLEHRPC